MTMTPAGRFALALQLTCAYTAGCLLPYGASLLLDILPANESSPHALRSLAWLAAWVLSVGLAAYLIARLARRWVRVSAIAAALGGLSALVAPFLVYGFPWWLLVRLWPEAALLCLALPLAITLFARLPSPGSV